MASSTEQEIGNYNCLESYILIWLIDKSDSAMSDYTIQNELRSIINYQKTFDNVEECRQFIDAIKNERLVIITSEKFEKEIVFTVDQWEKTSAVYLYCEDRVPSADLSEGKKHVRNINTKQKNLEHNSYP